MVERADESNLLIRRSPREHITSVIPSIIRESAFGLIEQLEETDLGTTSFQELVAALIYRTLMDGPEHSARILQKYKNSSLSEVFKLDLMSTWEGPRRGRPKPRQLYLKFGRS